MRKLGLFLGLVLVAILGIAQESSISVITYNIRLDVASDGQNAWPNRKEGLVQQIQFYEPSIFGIQEGLPHQTSYLSEQLKEYTHFGIGRYGEGKGEQSAIFYKKKQFEVLQSSTFWLSLTPKEPSKNWDAALPRICTYGLFKETETGKKFWVFNTHFDHKGVESRLKAIDMIEAKIKALNVDSLPVILMGDLNVEPNSKVISKLKLFMNDAFDVAERSFGPNATFNGFKFNEAVTKRIDYVFVSKSEYVKVLKHAILTDSNNLKYYSDHFPVFASLSINN